MILDFASRATRFYIEKIYLANLHKDIDSLYHSKPQPVPVTVAPRYQVFCFFFKKNWSIILLID